MPVEIREASESDITGLLGMMRNFYAHERLPFEPSRSERLLRELMTHDGFGRVLLFLDAGQLLGYLVLTFGYSLEFHGRDALVDEFYVVESERGRGIGTQALANVAGLCDALGIVAVHLEADHQNLRAYEFYKRMGFQPHKRHLMTWWLKD